MNAQFKTKLIQHLAAKKANKGFTLIELLVVVIIIGVLAAIALPNLLAQVGKARESEAKSFVGAVNRAQQGYYTENAAFASSLDLVEVPAGNPKYYAFSIPSAALVDAVGNSNPKNGTRNYQGGVNYNTGNRTFNTIVCRSNNNANSAFDNSAVTSTQVGELSSSTITCSGGVAVK